MELARKIRQHARGRGIRGGELHRVREHEFSVAIEDRKLGKGPSEPSWKSDQREKHVAAEEPHPKNAKNEDCVG